MANLKIQFCFVSFVTEKVLFSFDKSSELKYTVVINFVWSIAEEQGCRTCRLLAEGEEMGGGGT